MIFRGTISSGAITVDLKAGENLTGFVSGTSLHATALTLIGGNGNDSFRHEAGHTLVVYGALTVKPGDGDNAWLGSAGGTLKAGSLTIQALHGLDSFIFDEDVWEVAGTVKISLGNGPNGFAVTSLDAWIGGSLSYTGGSGTDIVQLHVSNSLRVGGSLQFQMGAGAAGASIVGSTFYAGGSLSYSGGADNDELVLQHDSTTVMGAVNFNAGSGGGGQLSVFSTIASLGSVNYTGGAGQDSLHFGNPTTTTTDRLTVQGNVSFKPGAGNSALLLLDTVVQGALLTTTTSKAGDTDAFTSVQSSLHGKVTVVHGAGESDVQIFETFVRNDFSLSTGAGDDIIRLGNTSGRAYKNEWFGKVSINAGSGDDDVYLGQLLVVDANVGNIFYASGIVDGGTHAAGDTLIRGGNTYRGDTLEEKNFP